MLQTGYERGTKDSDVLETAAITVAVKARLLVLGGEGTDLHRRHRLYVEVVGNGIPPNIPPFWRDLPGRAGGHPPRPAGGDHRCARPSLRIGPRLRPAAASCCGACRWPHAPLTEVCGSSHRGCRPLTVVRRLGSGEPVRTGIAVRCVQGSRWIASESRSQCPLDRLFRFQIMESLADRIDSIAPPSRLYRWQKVDPTLPRSGAMAPTDSLPGPWLSHLWTGETLLRADQTPSKGLQDRPLLRLGPRSHGPPIRGARPTSPRSTSERPAPRSGGIDALRPTPLVPSPL
jgi:hypothetical protein